LRGFTYIAFLGTSCIIMSGLPEVLVPHTFERGFLILKACMGPASGAVALTYFGMWLGSLTTDLLLQRTITWGAATLAISAIIMGIWASLTSPENFANLLMVAAAINAVSVILALMVSVRASELGDPLGRGQIVSCLFLAVMVAGLYGKSLGQNFLGLTGWIITAVCTMAYFMIAMGLAMVPIQQSRRLKQLASFASTNDKATGLATGSVLLSKVEDAFWRASRLSGNCTVVCIHLRNLYELTESAGHEVDQQILAILAARIRRAVGFRCIVGLYHPRCFVVVITTVGNVQGVARRAEMRLKFLLSKPLPVIALDGTQHAFSPRFGVGALTVSASSGDPSTTMDTAERMALEASAISELSDAETAAAPLGTAAAKP
jgi:GGDEF domain-containing protein